MPLTQYVSRTADHFSFTRRQASRFAKQVADDFNPIHDEDAKRFCVPGDLLFAVALTSLGLSQSMHIRFADMVSDGVELHFERSDPQRASIQDSSGKVYLAVEAEGASSHEPTVIERLVEQYVAFSGKTFPHVLVPLWQQHNVMVNPARPLVIYESMSLNLQSLDFRQPVLSLAGSSLEVNGKRGSVKLTFEFHEGKRLLGHGEKRMVLSGLKAYDQAAIDDLVAFYSQRKLDLAG